MTSDSSTERVIYPKRAVIPQIVRLGSCLLSLTIQNQAFSVSLLHMVVWDTLFSIPFIPHRFPNINWSLLAYKRHSDHVGMWFLQLKLEHCQLRCLAAVTVVYSLPVWRLHPDHCEDISVSEAPQSGYNYINNWNGPETICYLWLLTGTVQLLAALWKPLSFPNGIKHLNRLLGMLPCSC